MLNQISKRNIDEILFQFLKQIYHYERELDTRLGLNYQQICLLQFLRRCSTARVSEIADMLQIPLFQTTRLVDRLVARGYLQKERGQNDRREVFVSILSGGEEALEQVEAYTYHLIQANAGQLSEEELRGFLLAATNIHKLLGAPAENQHDQ